MLSLIGILPKLAGNLSILPNQGFIGPSFGSKKLFLTEDSENGRCSNRKLEKKDLGVRRHRAGGYGVLSNQQKGSLYSTWKGKKIVVA
ncbi:MAG: hypothetical protein A3G20_03095 [Acidobacteria bacterium RIFCSPLOWO2_12_FULL_59_11]|nr:MAG: hypothetical protein A3G20_03095 [Acidobacteria bacterium RIFCSPLOWO2_12_FULL_59_11]